MLELEDPLYPFFDGTGKPHMATVWKNIHYTELKDSIVFDTLPNTLMVGFKEEHLSRVRVYAWAVMANNKIALDGRGSHEPIYTYDDYGRARSITLKNRKGSSESTLPRIAEMANMLDDTGMATVHVTRVGIEPVLAVEAFTGTLEEALLPNLKELVIPSPKKLETPAVFRAALVYPTQGTRVILPFGESHYQLEEHSDHVVFSGTEDAWRLIPWIESYTHFDTGPVRLEIWWEPDHKLMLNDGIRWYGS